MKEKIKQHIYKEFLKKFPLDKTDYSEKSKEIYEWFYQKLEKKNTCCMGGCGNMNCTHC